MENFQDREVWLRFRFFSYTWSRKNRGSRSGSVFSSEDGSGSSSGQYQTGYKTLCTTISRFRSWSWPWCCCRFLYSVVLGDMKQTETISSSQTQWFQPITQPDKAFSKPFAGNVVVQWGEAHQRKGCSSLRWSYLFKILIMMNMKTWAYWRSLLVFFLIL